VPPGSDQLVGRTAELEALDAALDELERGRPGALALLGEPGIGKTRLLAELEARADRRRWLVLAGSASELEDELPFGIFVDALDEYVQAAGPRLDAETRAELAHVLPALPAAGPAAALRDERYRAHQAVRRLLELLAADRPLVLALDDLHWADSGSLELLGALLRRPPGAPVLLALALRPCQIPERLWAALERGIGVARIEVGALSLDEAQALLGRADRDAAALWEESGGNPFYLQQLARAPARRPRAPAAGEVPDAVAAALARSSRCSATTPAGCSRAPPWPATRSSRSWPPPRPRSRRPRRSRRSTSCCAATSSGPPTSRGASASATRWCVRRCTRPRRAAGGSARTSAAPPRWPGAAPPPRRARTTSSRPAGTATPRRSPCCAKRGRRSPGTPRPGPRAGSPRRCGCCRSRRRSRSASGC
jgi:hypothetical protein